MLVEVLLFAECLGLIMSLRHEKIVAATIEWAICPQPFCRILMAGTRIPWM